MTLFTAYYKSVPTLHALDRLNYDDGRSSPKNNILKGQKCGLCFFVIDKMFWLVAHSKKKVSYTN